jgi:hypothetical protein
MQFPRGMNRIACISAHALFLCAWTFAITQGEAQVPLPTAKPVPRMQAVPLAHHEVSFQRDGIEIARCHFDPTDLRPFVFPVIGPAGRSLTRMGHPRDPVTHSHHNSVWISHDNVGGVDFWADQGSGRIVHQRVEEFVDGEDECAVLTVNHWLAQDGKVPLEERRRTAARSLREREWLLLVDLELKPRDGEITLSQSAFGLIGVRVAKTLGIKDGGGLIRNSEGNVNEQGENGCFRKRARWCDYSGPIAPGVNEGLTLFDHPANPNHPSHFHVRADGWMGTSLTFGEPMTISVGKPVRLRYGLYVHANVPVPEKLDQEWRAFAALPLARLADQAR